MEGPGVAQIIEQQLKALEEFERNTSKTLPINDALNYLEYWEQASTKKLVAYLAPEDIQKLKAVWLEQRFELSPEQQLAALIKKFRQVMDRLKGSAPE